VGFGILERDEFLVRKGVCQPDIQSTFVFIFKKVNALDTSSCQSLSDIFVTRRIHPLLLSLKPLSTCTR
jgi:hypothetical protein